MPNENCLEGMACPKCKSEGPFEINCCATVLMTDEGSENVHDIDWDVDSSCMCHLCRHDGVVSDFHLPEESEPTKQDREEMEADRRYDEQNSGASM